MKLLILLVVAVGVSLASPAGFLQNTPEVQAATIKFIHEYNRLARLAAEAPDIHIYHKHPRPINNRVKAAVPVSQFRTNPVFNVYEFTAQLGSNRQFQPHQFRSGIHRQHAVQSFPRIQNSLVVAPKTERRRRPYTGPFADTVPAGLHGAPVPVSYTPAVQAARDAHFRAHALAIRAPRVFV